MHPYNAENNKIQGWMNNAELEWLYDNAKGKGVIVEIGSWRGRSTHALCSGAQVVDFDKGEKAGLVFAVDTFKGSPNQADTVHVDAKTHNIEAECKENLKEFYNVFIIASDSIEASKQFADKSIDMIFLDAEHTKESVIKDYNAWRPKLKDNGLFCGHDMLEDGVPIALKELGVKHRQTAGTIWVEDDTLQEQPTFPTVYAYCIPAPPIGSEHGM